MKIETQLTQLGRDPAKQTGFVNGPIYRGSTVVYPSMDDLVNRRAEFTYGTAGTPTIRDLENAWTALTGGAGTVLSPSGLGAIALALLTTLKSGDHLLMPDSVYSPSRAFCDDFLQKMNVRTTYYDPLIKDEITELFAENTTVLFLESPVLKPLKCKMCRISLPLPINTTSPPSLTIHGQRRSFLMPIAMVVIFLLKLAPNI
ncbi:cystathionine beta-lyase [Wohlfahrtiimonas chitiniclastica]|nr:cystathionine beta-lyase [Wohlfahrtiimonas chitiniclastica]